MKKIKNLKRILSLALVIVFMSETVLAQTPQVSFGVNAAANSEIKTISQELLLPKEMGKIEINGENKPALYLIQDPHGHYEGQKNIQRILEVLYRKKELHEIFLEGAAGRQDLKLLEFFKQPEFNRQAVRLLAHEAEAGGAELFLSGNPEAGKRVPVTGIEDPAVYLENVRLFTQVQEEKEESEKYLRGSFERLGTEASHFNPALLKFFRQWVNFETEKSGLEIFLHELQESARETLKVDLEDPRQQLAWPMLVRYAELKDRESKLDEKKAGEEKKKLLQWAGQKRISKNLIAQLKAGDFQNGRRAFWQNFYDAASAKGFSFQDYPALSVSEGFYILREEMESRDFYSETEKIRDEILNALAESQEEKRLIENARDFLLLRKILRLEITPSELQQIKARLISSGFVQKLPASIAGIYRDSLSFYRIAEDRDRIMLDKILKQQPDSKRPAAVILGGFHTPGITRELQNRGLSYALVTPHLPEIESSEKYIAAMTGEKPKPDFQYFAARVPAWTTPHGEWRGKFPEALAASRASLRALIEQKGLEQGAVLNPALPRSEIRGVLVEPADESNDATVLEAAWLARDFKWILTHYPDAEQRAPGMTEIAKNLEPFLPYADAATSMAAAIPEVTKEQMNSFYWKARKNLGTFYAAKPLVSFTLPPEVTVTQESFNLFGASALEYFIPYYMESPAAFQSQSQYAVEINGVVYRFGKNQYIRFRYPNGNESVLYDNHNLFYGFAASFMAWHPSTPKRYIHFDAHPDDGYASLSREAEDGRRGYERSQDWFSISQLYNIGNFLDGVRRDLLDYRWAWTWTGFRIFPDVRDNSLFQTGVHFDSFQVEKRGGIGDFDIDMVVRGKGRTFSFEQAWKMYLPMRDKLIRDLPHFDLTTFFISDDRYIEPIAAIHMFADLFPRIAAEKIKQPLIRHEIRMSHPNEQIFRWFKRAGVEYEDFKSGEKGYHLPTQSPQFHELAGVFPNKPVKVFDAGSGQGVFALRLMKSRPEIFISGVEWNQQFVEDGRKVVSIAEEEGAIPPGHVEFFQGDFNDPQWRQKIAEADYVYFYDSGTKDWKKWIQTLVSAMRPGARFVVNGSSGGSEFLDQIERMEEFKKEELEGALWVRVFQRTDVRPEIRNAAAFLAADEHRIRIRDSIRNAQLELDEISYDEAMEYIDAYIDRIENDPSMKEYNIAHFAALKMYAGKAHKTTLDLKDGRNLEVLYVPAGRPTRYDWNKVVYVLYFLEGKPVAYTIGDIGDNETPGTVTADVGFHLFDEHRGENEKAISSSKIFQNSLQLFFAAYPHIQKFLLNTRDQISSWVGDEKRSMIFYVRQGFYAPKAKEFTDSALEESFKRKFDLYPDSDDSRTVIQPMMKIVRQHGTWEFPMTEARPEIRQQGDGDFDLGALIKEVLEHPRLDENEFKSFGKLVYDQMSGEGKNIRNKGIYNEVFGKDTRRIYFGRLLEDIAVYILDRKLEDGNDEENLKLLALLEKLIARYNADYPDAVELDLPSVFILPLSPFFEEAELDTFIKFRGRFHLMPGEYKYRTLAFDLFVTGMHLRGDFVMSDTVDFERVLPNLKAALEILDRSERGETLETPLSDENKKFLEWGVLKFFLTVYPAFLESLDWRQFKADDPYYYIDWYSEHRPEVVESLRKQPETRSALEQFRKHAGLIRGITAKFKKRGLAHKTQLIAMQFDFFTEFLGKFKELEIRQSIETSLKKFSNGDNEVQFYLISILKYGPYSLARHFPRRLSEIFVNEKRLSDSVFYQLDHLEQELDEVLQQRAEIRMDYSGVAKTYFAKAGVPYLDEHIVTRVGAFRPVYGDVVDRVAGRLPSGHKVKIIDMGHGQGGVVFAFAAANREAELLGIEYDEDLHRDSVNVLAAAPEEMRRRIRFERGDYNDPKYAQEIAQADYVYYWETGTAAEEKLLNTLAKNMKPGAQLIIIKNNGALIRKINDSNYFSLRPVIGEEREIFFYERNKEEYEPRAEIRHYLRPGDEDLEDYYSYLLESLGFELLNEEGQLGYRAGALPFALNFNLVMIPHGDTDANKRNVFHGRYSDGKPENSINEEGERQADSGGVELRELIARMGWDFSDLIFKRTPLSRTEETSKLSLQHLKDLNGGQVIVPEVEELAAEIDFGKDEWDGRNAEEIIAALGADEARFLTAYRNLNGFVRAPSGENFLMFAARVKQLFEKWNKEYAGKTVVLYGHKTFAAAVGAVMHQQEFLIDGRLNWRIPPHLMPRGRPTLLEKTQARSEIRSSEARFSPLNPSKPILAFGSSSTYGFAHEPDSRPFPDLLQNKIGRTVINVGYAGAPGEVITQAAERLPATLDWANPALLILWHGRNDLWPTEERAVQDQRIELKLREMIRAAKERNIQVLLLGAPRPGEDLDAAVYKRVANEEGIPYLPHVMNGVLGNEKFMRDEVHANNEGNEIFAQRVADFLEERGALNRPEIRTQELVDEFIDLAQKEPKDWIIGIEDNRQEESRWLNAGGYWEMLRRVMKNSPELFSLHTSSAKKGGKSRVLTIGLYSYSGKRYGQMTHRMTVESVEKKMRELTATFRLSEALDRATDPSEIWVPGAKEDLGRQVQKDLAVLGSWRSEYQRFLLAEDEPYSLYAKFRRPVTTDFLNDYHEAVRLAIYGADLFDYRAIFSGHDNLSLGEMSFFNDDALNAKWIEAQKGKKVLDIGGVAGWWIRDLRNAGSDAWGLDADEEAIRRSSELGIQDFMTFGDARFMPYGDAAFDTVYSRAVIASDGVKRGKGGPMGYWDREEIPAGAVRRPVDVLAAFYEIHRVLKTGGRAYLDDAFYPEDVWQILSLVPLSIIPNDIPDFYVFGKKNPRAEIRSVAKPGFEMIDNAAAQYRREVEQVLQRYEIDQAWEQRNADIFAAYYRFIGAVTGVLGENVYYVYPVSGPDVAFQAHAKTFVLNTDYIDDLHGRALLEDSGVLERVDYSQLEGDILFRNRLPKDGYLNAYKFGNYARIKRAKNDRLHLVLKGLMYIASIMDMPESDRKEFLGRLLEKYFKTGDRILVFHDEDLKVLRALPGFSKNYKLMYRDDKMLEAPQTAFRGSSVIKLIHIPEMLRIYEKVRSESRVRAGKEEMTGGAAWRPEIRSKEEAKLFEVFGDQEGARVKYQAQWIAQVFEKLTPGEKRTLVYPNLLMTLLGVKPLYYQTEEGSPHPKDLVSAMYERGLFNDSRLDFYADERRTYSLLHTAIKLLQSRRFFESKGLLQPEDAAVLDQMDRMFRSSGSTEKIYELTVSLVDKITERIEKGQEAQRIQEQLHFFFGTFFDHSLEDMEAYWAAIQTGVRPAFNDPRFKSAGYYATSIFTQRPASQNRWLRRAKASLDYVYSLLEKKSGFEEASRDYKFVRHEIRTRAQEESPMEPSMHSMLEMMDFALDVSDAVLDLVEAGKGPVNWRLKFMEYFDQAQTVGSFLISRGYVFESTGHVLDESVIEKLERVTARYHRVDAAQFSRKEIRAEQKRKSRGEIFYDHVQEFRRKEKEFSGLLAGILKPLAAKTTVTRQELFETLTARQEEVFAMQRDLRKTANQMAVYNDYELGMIMYRTLNVIESPDCGLCRESADALIEGIKEAGLENVLKPRAIQFKDGFNVLHKYVMIETKEGQAAVDLAAGQMLDEPRGMIRVELFSEYSASVAGSILGPSAKKIADVRVREPIVSEEFEALRRQSFRPEIRTVIEVAKEMTARILPVSQAEALIDLILPAALAQEAVEPLTANEKEILINYYTALFRSGGKAVLPAGALQTLESGKSLFDYFDLVLKGAKRANVKSPVVYVAGQGSQEIKNRVFSAEHFRLNPKFMIDGPKIFSFSPQSEVVVAERLKRESLAVSFAKEPEEKITASIPAFLLDQDALRELSVSDRLEYLSRLTQLQLLAAEQLKDSVKEIPAFLAKAGIQFELSAGGFVRPSAQSLLSEKFTQLMASQLSQQSA